MMKPKHILVCGEVGVGKSTLVARLLAQSAMPVYGFVTKKLEADETGFHPIYIHRADTPQDARVWTEENCIGTCNRRIHNIRLDTFNTLGVSYLSQAAPGGLIVMDELGFMEAKAERFVQAVFAALDGTIPVLAALKARYDVPFLNAVRAHQNATLYQITEDNRDALYEELLPAIRGWAQGDA